MYTLKIEYDTEAARKLFISEITFDTLEDAIRVAKTATSILRAARSAIVYTSTDGKIQYNINRDGSEWTPS